MSDVSVLKDFLIAEIDRHGAMSLADYMGHVLGHPEFGYYMTRDPFGAAGDFITAPEISQIFGEVMGIWVVDAWLKLVSPARFVLLECGPGRGTLMADLLRAAGQVDGFLDAAEICLLEISPVLRKAQGAALAGRDVRWINDLDDLPEDVPLIVIGNEFLDALPVHQLQYSDGQWFERCVTHEAGQLAFVERPAANGLIDLLKVGGGLVEVSPVRIGFMRDLAMIVARSGGAGAIIDYGYGEPAAGDTLQAVYKHKSCGIFEYIGEADITAHVDFSSLMQVLRDAGMGAAHLSGQGAFLRGMGAEMRLSALLKAASAEQAADMKAGYERLIGRDQMGELFKVITFFKGVS
jgi:NADH dehydrogenase [ubiquinone] 1 alpha subcomplex assembly factor 7